MAIKGEMKKEMPNPTIEDLNSVVYEAIWQTIKDWDINVPDYYDGYCSATGSHVKLILDSFKIEDILRGYNNE